MLAHHLTPGSGPTILFLPGYASDMSGSKALALEGWARQAGARFVRFDYRGCGESPGRFADFTLADWRDDALAMLDAHAPAPAILVGSSMGGWLALMIARDHPERVAGLVGIAAAPDFTDWGFTAEERVTLARDGRLERPNPYGPEPTLYTHALWQSGQENRVLGRPIAFDGPVRLLHGMADPDVPWHLAPRIAQLIRSADVQLSLIKDGDHRLSRDADVALLIRAVEDVENPMLLIAAALLQAGPASPDEARYTHCLALVEADPSAAVRDAESWRAAGGRFLARQCLALAYAKASHFVAAAAEFDAAAEDAEAAHDARAARLRAQAGNAWLAGNNAQAARKSLDAALAAGTLTGLDRGEALLDRGRALVLAGDLSGARRDIDAALKEADADPLAWLLSASLARRAGDLPRARTDIAEALKRSSDDASVQLEAGNIAAVARDEAGARLHWQEASRLGGDRPVGQSARAALAQFEGK